MTRAGFPATTAWAGTSDVTTEFAPMTLPLPILRPRLPTITAPVPSQQLSSISTEPPEVQPWASTGFEMSV